MKLRITETNCVPTGDYAAKVVAIEYNAEGTYGPQFCWRFEITAPAAYAGQRLLAWSSASPSQQGKLVRWAVACLGRDIAPGEVLDTADCLGCTVTISVTLVESESGMKANRITDVHPAAETPKPVAARDRTDDLDALFG
ncbi:MAG: hypothetical protein BWY76_03350 [bacterium ADurb.Bin429]|nr:MAG: hypothetical protein BWY76_03350 [bacterium ADurb.Bin429]